MLTLSNPSQVPEISRQHSSERQPSLCRLGRGAPRSVGSSEFVISLCHDDRSPLVPRQVMQSILRHVVGGETVVDRARAQISERARVIFGYYLACAGIVHEHGRGAGEHIVRVGYSRPARRVTYRRRALTWPFVDGLDSGSRRRVALTATVTATWTTPSAPVAT